MSDSRQDFYGRDYVALEGDAFAGEPVVPGTLLRWDASAASHYPASEGETRDFAVSVGFAPSDAFGSTLAGVRGMLAAMAARDERRDWIHLDASVCEHGRGMGECGPCQSGEGLEERRGLQLAALEHVLHETVAIADGEAVDAFSILADAVAAFCGDEGPASIGERLEEYAEQRAEGV